MAKSARTKRFPVTTGVHEEADALEVAFTDFGAGCIFFRIAPLAPDWCFAATHLSDPFPGMIAWLEAIADGAASATWVIDSEGSVDRLTFVAAHEGFDRASGLLLHSCSYEDQLFRTSACLLSARAVLDGFYRSFRAWVGSDAYVPDEWEWKGGQAPDEPDPDEDPEAHAAWCSEHHDPWEGTRLRLLRSARVEAVLHGPDAEQLALDLEVRLRSAPD